MTHSLLCLLVYSYTSRDEQTIGKSYILVAHQVNSTEMHSNGINSCHNHFRFLIKLCLFQFGQTQFSICRITISNTLHCYHKLLPFLSNLAFPQHNTITLRRFPIALRICRADSARLTFESARCKLRVRNQRVKQCYAFA